MASFLATTPTSPPSTIRSDQKQPNLRINGPISNSVTFKTGKKRELKVKAMMGGGGGAKYKGTLMKEKKLTEMIETKVKEAEQVCEGDEASDECKVAWDEVEEITMAKADLRRRLEKEDPLEYFCQDHPETDECRVYED